MIDTLTPSFRPRTDVAVALPRPSAIEVTVARPAIRGKFVFTGGEKLLVRGVTYGTFRPDADGHEYPDPDTVESDFVQMASHGINAVRVYTMPPAWLLDAAARSGLRVMTSLAVERFAGYLADRQTPPQVERSMRNALERVAGHRAILCHAIGNEIPAAMVRWLGRARVERYLRRMCHLVKSIDPDGLVTYANYPSAEYLHLPFLDLVCFNLYLESPATFEAYLARLQNLAGDRPLIMSEIGLDSIRNTEPHQAHAIEWQLRRSFNAGCAGAFVYSWTDEWHRGGEDVYDWAFGLVRRDRSPKVALRAVSSVFEERPLPAQDRRIVNAGSRAWPAFSVVVCSHNGRHRIAPCCDALLKLDYPGAFEIIVVDDGSTDGTGETVEALGIRVIRTDHIGLSGARNVGLEAATGDIVAYIDDDAYPDPHWLRYLATTFLSGDCAGVGGPNIVPDDDGLIAHCVANAPGGPIHVLLTDREAEHIPGCNMAFRRDALLAIGGFDTQFRAAGDDVDVCWRIRDRGWRLGFSPAAVVWHHRRPTVGAYWRQQQGYGKAEALLHSKWPQKYNLAGHATWTGRIYDHTPDPVLVSAPRVYFGIWGTAPFQYLYQRPMRALHALPHIPEWHLFNAALVLVVLMGLFWPPLLWSLVLLAAAVAFPLIQGIRGAAMARLPARARSWPQRAWLRGVTAVLHTTQPLARLYGRIRYGLAPWRRRGDARLGIPRMKTVKFWTRHWQSGDDRLRALERALRATLHFVIVGSETDPWDLEVRGGFLGGARLVCAVEEHGAGCQTVRFRVWPRLSIPGLVVVGVLASLAYAASRDHALVAATTLGLSAIALAGRIAAEAGFATSALLGRIDRQ